MMKKLEELNLDTYQHFSNKTGGYPFGQFSQGYPEEKNNISNKHSRVNSLSLDLFEREFYKKFPKDNISIYLEDDKGQKNYELVFKYFSFSNNYGKYSLIFEYDNKISTTRITIYPHIRDNKHVVEMSNSDLEKISSTMPSINENSKKILKAMLLFGSKKNISESEKLKGGLADGKTLKDVAEKHNLPLKYIKMQFDMGVNTELEHTKDIKLASEIALDHLMEKANYYSLLKKMEKK